MTVVLAVRCADGLVMGSDSQITEKDRDLAYPDRKLHPLGDRAAWGGSGARSVLYELEQRFEEDADEIVEADDVGRALQDRVVPVLRHHYDQFIPDIPGEESEATPSAYVLAAGYSRDDPFIVKIDPAGLIGHYEDVGFHAIGSGSPMAQQAAALMGHFQMAERDIAYGELAIVRVLDALTVSQPQVGGPLNLVRLRPDGAHHLDEEEIDDLREVVSKWEDAEQAALDDLLDEL